ncbi:MAG: ATP-grasp domain-containing protein [Promethearchaeota archaeon]
MIYFIIYRPDHPTNRDIIRHLKTNAEKIPFEVLDPSMPKRFFRDKFRNFKKFKNSEKKPLLLIKPDHPGIYKICKLATEMGIPAVNNPQITEKFVSRWNIEKQLLNTINSAHKSNLFTNITMAPSLFIKTEKKLTGAQEWSEFFKKFKKENLRNIHLMPFVIKYPLNHTGFHFIAKILNIEQISSSDNIKELLNSDGLIVQEYIKIKGPILKCYKMGTSVISLKQPQRFQEIQNIHEFIEKKGSKSARKTVKTPKEIINFIHYIGNKLKLELFGIDLGRTSDGSDRHYYTIDINDFPGYQGVKNAGKKIAHYCIKKYLHDFDSHY